MRTVRRVQHLLALATSIDQPAAGQSVGFSHQAVGNMRRHYKAASWQAAFP